MAAPITRARFEESIRIDTDAGAINGTLAIPEEATAVVIFAHGSGSSRHSPRNIFVAEALHEGGLATLLVDLLTEAEEHVDEFTGQHRFDIELLTERLLAATDWVKLNCSHHCFRQGYFGASTGAAAALKAAARRPEVAAVVSRGGRPDLAGEELAEVKAATLLIVGGRDVPVIGMNERALEELVQASPKELKIVAGATHLFPEAGALEEVARLAREWFARYLGEDKQDQRGSYGTSTTGKIH